MSKDPKLGLIVANKRANFYRSDTLMLQGKPVVRDPSPCGIEFLPANVKVADLQAQVKRLTEILIYHGLAVLEESVPLDGD